MAEPEDIDRIALLREPSRRALYAFVRDAGRPVGRDEAAAGVGVSRSLAAFHLDRLAEAGLLDVEYRRLSGRSGRGAGRPAKLYRRGARRVDVSVPPSRYALLGEVLLRALETKEPGESPEEAARAAGRELGRDVGRELRPRVRSRTGAGRMREALQELGFEPEQRRGEIALRNCPFHDLVAGHTRLVCGLNHAFVRGIAEGVGAQGIEAVPSEDPAFCCVAIRDR